MLMFFNGLNYLHIDGKVFICRDSYVDWADWVAVGGDKDKLVWKHQPARWPY